MEQILPVYLKLCKVEGRLRQDAQVEATLEGKLNVDYLLPVDLYPPEEFAFRTIYIVEGLRYL